MIGLLFVVCSPTRARPRSLKCDLISYEKSAKYLLLSPGKEMTMPRYDDDDAFERASFGFADPGGRSALRAASKRNPRNLPCPTCKEPNRLTPADRARGYQCDRCADRAEYGF